MVEPQVEENNYIDESGDKKYFTVIPNTIINGFNAVESGVYLYIKRRAGEMGRFFETQETTCKNLDINKKKYCKILKHLETEAVIEQDGWKEGKTHPVKVYKIKDVWEDNSKRYGQNRPSSLKDMGKIDPLLLREKRDMGKIDPLLLKDMGKIDPLVMGKIDPQKKNHIEEEPIKGIEEKPEELIVNNTLVQKGILDEIKPKKIPNPDIKIFLDWFCLEYQNRLNKKYVVSGAKEGSIIKRLLSYFSLDELKNLVNLFFEADDAFIIQSGYTLGIFSSVINKLQLTKGKTFSKNTMFNMKEYQKIAQKEGWV